MGLDIADILMDIEEYYGIVIDTGNTIETIDDMVKVIQGEVAKRKGLDIGDIINGALPIDCVTANGYDSVRRIYKYLPKLQYRYQYTTLSIVVVGIGGLLIIGVWPFWVIIGEAMLIILLIADVKYNRRCVVPRPLNDKSVIMKKVYDTEAVVIKNEDSAVLNKVIEIVRERSGYSGEIIPNSRLVRDLHLG